MNNKYKKTDFETELVKNNVELSTTFRENLLKYAGKCNMTMTDIANKSNVPLNTINSFLHHVSNDMKVSNVAKIAKTLNVSIDELVGADTLHELTKESLDLSRNLPYNDLYLVRWFIRHLNELNQKNKPNKRYISVMLPEIDNDDNLKITCEFEKIEISRLEKPLNTKIFLGLKIEFDNYMPHYMPNDIILIANDRKPKPNENVLIRVGNYLFIAKQYIESGVAKYYSIRDKKFRLDENNIDELIGYIAIIKK